MTANYLRAVNQSIPTWTWGITFFYFSAGIYSGLAAMADAGAVEQAMMEVASAMGFSELKEKQVEAILALVSGKNVLVSLPTGYGKSVIYGILPLLFNKLKG